MRSYENAVTMLERNAKRGRRHVSGGEAWACGNADVADSGSRERALPPSCRHGRGRGAEAWTWATRDGGKGRRAGVSAGVRSGGRGRGRGIRDIALWWLLFFLIK